MKYNNLTPFKWCIIENFPFIEEDFDAITNYQLFCKVVEYLNKTINTTNMLGSKVEEFSNYFENLNVDEEINKKLDEMAKDGTLTQLINNIFTELKNDYFSLQNSVNSEIATMNKKIDNSVSNYPLVADSIDEMTDTSKIYVNTSDGNWYYYNGENWISGGIYQAVKISPNNIQLDGRNVESKILPFNYNFNKFVNNFEWEQGPITIDSSTNELVFGNINVNYPRLRTPENAGIVGNNNYLQIFNLNSDVYSYRMYWKDNDNKGYAEPDYFRDEFRKYYLENGKTYYIQFLNKNNIEITVEEVINNFKIAIGNSQNTPAVKISLGNNYNSNPNIDTNNKTLTFSNGTILHSMKNNYSINGTLDLLSTGSTCNLIVYDIDNNMLKVEAFGNISNIEYRFLLIGVLKHLIQNNKLRIVSFSIPCEYSVDGIRKDILLSGLNSNINNKLINGTITGAGQITTYDHRVRSNQPFEFNGIIKIKVPSDIRPNVARFDKQNNYLNHIVGVTGNTLVASLSSQYNYYLQFDSDPDTVLDPLYVIENIHIDFIPISETLIDYNIKSNIDSIGHQGFGVGTNGFRGNSRSGFIAGAKFGFSSLECDMLNTSDNVIVLGHDNVITDDNGEQITISDTTYEDLLTHTFDGETICTLDEFINICKIYGCNAYLDKTGTIANSSIRMNNVKNIIQKYYMEDKVTFSPYSLEHIPLIYNLNSNYKQAYQMFNAELDEQWYKDFVNLKGNNTGELSIEIDYNQLNETVYTYCRKYNIKLYTFTIDNLDTYKQIMPFVSGIISNRYKSVDALM